MDAVRFEAVHNYNRDSREAMYAWMARWLQAAPAGARRPETPFTPDALPDLLVFHQRSVPPGAVTSAELTTNWIDAAISQLWSTPLEVRARALRHALGFGQTLPVPPGPGASHVRTVLVAGIDTTLERQLRSAGLTVQAIAFAPFDAEEAAKVPHFDTYNRTAAAQRVADIVAAMRTFPEAPLVAAGDAALAGVLASAIEPGRVAILDVGAFDTSSDTDFVARMYVPGLRRAGDFSTAAALAGDRVVIHNAGERFILSGSTPRRERLSAREILALLRRR